MLRRTMDARFLNTVANSPGVREWLGGDGVLDFTAALANPANVGLQDDAGGFIGEQLSPGLYECHSMFYEADRGFATYEAMRQGLRYLFVETDCAEVVTKVPLDNRAARGLALKAGFVKAFCRDNAWTGHDGHPCGVEYMTLSYWAWLRGDDEIEAWGKRFHRQLEDMASIPEHPEDSAHNRAVGACALMCMSGNAQKGVFFYNRWARLAGYPPVRLIGLAPPIIDMDQVVVSIRNREMEILKCLPV